MNGTNGIYERPGIRSAEVQDILSRPPVWITRWGSIVILLFVFLLLLLAWMIPAPETIGMDLKVSRREAALPAGVEGKDMEYEAFGQLPQRYYSRIHKGQDVLVRLAAFPDDGTGALNGLVEAITDSFDVSSGAFRISISLPRLNSALHASDVHYRNAMIGSGVIVITQARLIDKLWPF